MKGEQARGQGVLRCATHSSPSHPLTTDRRKTHPPTTNRLKRRGADPKEPPFGNLLCGDNRLSM